MSTPIRGCTCTDPARLGGKHKCTPGRPRCRRTDSRRNRTCLCAAYHYAHREGSGRCTAHPLHVERMNLVLYGPPPDLDLDLDSEPSNDTEAELSYCPF